MSKRVLFSFILMISLVLSCLGFSITQAETTQECYDKANKTFLDCINSLDTSVSGGEAEQACSQTLKDSLNGCSYSPNEVGSIINPLGVAAKDARIFVGNIIRAILALVGSIALILFVVAGFQWMTARGNPEQVKKSTQTMLWAAMGLLAIFSSFLILEFILKSLGVPKP